MTFWTIFTLFCLGLGYVVIKMSIKHLKEFKKNMLAYRVTQSAKKIRSSNRFRHENSGRLMGSKYRDEMRVIEKNAAQKSDSLSMEDFLMIMYFHQWFIPRDYSYRQFEQITGLKSMMESYNSSNYQSNKMDDNLNNNGQVSRDEQEKSNYNEELMAGVAFAGGAAATAAYFEDKSNNWQESDPEPESEPEPYTTRNISYYESDNNSSWQRTEPEQSWAPTKSWENESVSTTSSWGSDSSTTYSSPTYGD